jgi:uncharacterized GH25 family protein
LVPAGGVLAHMPYVAPSVFDAGKRDHVTLEASFTEDAFRAEIAMKDAPFEVTGPDGATVRLPDPAFLTDITIVEATLPAEGIYRVSSGQRLGRMGKMYQQGGEWRMVGEDGDPPAGAALVAVQSTTLADAYIVRGRPLGTKALSPRGRALEIHPIADPTAIGAGDILPIEILQDGRPLANTEVSLFREAGLYDGRKVIAARTDAAGKAAIKVPDAGRYLILVRNRTAAPSGSAAPYLSYTATLAFEATD